MEFGHQFKGPLSEIEEQEFKAEEIKIEFNTIHSVNQSKGCPGDAMQTRVINVNIH